MDEREFRHALKPGLGRAIRYARDHDVSHFREAGCVPALLLRERSGGGDALVVHAQAPRVRSRQEEPLRRDSESASREWRRHTRTATIRVGSPPCGESVQQAKRITCTRHFNLRLVPEITLPWNLSVWTECKDCCLPRRNSGHSLQPTAAGLWSRATTRSARRRRWMPFGGRPHKPRDRCVLQEHTRPARASRTAPSGRARRERCQGVDELARRPLASTL